MNTKQKDEKDAWDKTLELMGEHHFELGPSWAESYLNEPEQLGFRLSYYKTAAKLIGDKRKILELECGEGLGSVILGEQADQYLGVDQDRSNIEIAKKNLPKKHINFEVGELNGEIYGKFEGVVALDADEALIEMVVNNLSENGVCVLGHFHEDGFKQSLQKYFHHIFPFGMNDEVIGTGRTDYVLYVGCFKKG